MSENYDLIFGLGASLLTADFLKKKNFQIFDFPFDYINGSNFLIRMSMFLNGCKNFIHKQQISEFGENPLFKRKQFIDKETQFIYPFDFNPDVPVENSYPTVKARYDKYIKHLYLFLRNAKKILIVYIEDPMTPEEDNDALIIEATGKLKKLYPEKEFNIIYVKNDDNDNENMNVLKLNKNAYRFTFKFYGQFIEGTPKILEEKLLSSVFADIKLKADWNTKKMLWLQKAIQFLNKIIYK